VEAAAAWVVRGAEVAGGRQRLREGAGGDQATMTSPRMRGRVLAWTRGHELSWAAGKQALPLNLFLKFQNQYRFCNSIW
jgi:hypothetical protein